VCFITFFEKPLVKFSIMEKVEHSNTPFYLLHHF
jgi:hypothetical protein